MSEVQNSPLVSVIIPTYKRPLLLRRALDSVFSQTLGNFEVIVVVDGPQSDTECLLNSIQDSRLRVVVNAENQGQAESKNVGIRNARSKWIALLDDDDEWLPEKLEKQLAAAEKLGGDYTLVFCRMIEKTSRVVRVIPHHLPSETKNFSEYLYCRRGFLGTMTWFGSARLFKEIPFKRGTGIEDTDWLLRAAADPRTRVGSIPDALGVFNNQSSGNRQTGGKWDVIYVWGVVNRHLFTGKALSLFFCRQCTARARENREPLGVFFLLLASGMFLGSFYLPAIGYFLAYSFLPPDTRRKIRSFISGRDPQ